MLIACTKGEAKNYVCNPERSGFCRQVCPTFARLKTLQNARIFMQTWEQEVADFEMKYAEKDRGE